jgi:hypothetical protein
MIDPNRGISKEVLRRHKEASYERFRIELLVSIEQLMEDFQMTWDDLADKLAWPSEMTYSPGQIEGKKRRKIYFLGSEVKRIIGSGMLSTKKLNDIAPVFSTEIYIIFRPRKPWTGS